MLQPGAIGVELTPNRSADAGPAYAAAMRAVLCRAYGPPESLTVEDVEDPVPGPGEVVVDVRACSTTFPDVLMIQGLYQFKPDFPFSPGSEVAGVVSAVGEGVDSVAVGDRIFAALGWGGMAERVKVPASAVYALPDGVELADAA